MATKSTTTQERIGRVGQRRQVVIPREMVETLNLREGDFVAFAEQKNGVLIKPRRVVNPDDVLTREQSAVVKKQLRHDLDRPHFTTAPQDSLKAIPPDRRERILYDIAVFEEDPFRGLVKPLKGKDHKGHYRRVSGRYRIIFKPIHSTQTVEVLAVPPSAHRWRVDRIGALRFPLPTSSQR